MSSAGSSLISFEEEAEYLGDAADSPAQPSNFVQVAGQAGFQPSTATSNGILGASSSNAPASQNVPYPTDQLPLGPPGIGGSKQGSSPGFFSNLSQDVAVVLGLLLIGGGIIMFRPISEAIISGTKAAAA